MRRFALAVTGVALSAWLLRPQLADALVVRGDGLLYASRMQAALRAYGRAIAIDGDDAGAVDRYSFFASTTRDRRAMAQAMAVTSAFLARHPDDVAIRFDRAMAERRLGWEGNALVDFATIAMRTGDARAWTFAGYAAAALGCRALARSYWRFAIEREAHFPAASDGLRRVRP